MDQLTTGKVDTVPKENNDINVKNVGATLSPPRTTINSGGQDINVYTVDQRKLSGSDGHSLREPVDATESNAKLANAPSTHQKQTRRLSRR